MHVDLRTTYLGLTLRSPIVASAGPLTGDLATLAALEEAGVGAVVLPSLFEEQIEAESLALDSLLAAGAALGPEAIGIFPELEPETGPHRHLDLVAEAKRRLRIPVIASLNGTSPGGWVRYARDLAAAGADALELNLYDVVADTDVTAEDVERRYADLVAMVRAEVGIPLSVKIGPWFTSPANVCRRLVAAGADGLVLFNRFYQPDIDTETLEVRPHLQLSTSSELRLTLHWIGILHGRLPASLAASTGVHTSDDVIRVLLAGADVAMTTSSLLRHGPGHVEVLEAGLRAWMEAGEYESVEQLKGSLSQHKVPNPAAYQRANYLQVIQSWGQPLHR